MQDPDGTADLRSLLLEARLTRRRLLAGGMAAGAGSLATAAEAAAAPTQTREYWIAAVPVTWNVVPNGRNPIEGKRFSPDQTTFRTVIYRAFTRGWRRPLPNQQALSGDNDGIPGPLIRARVGDRLLVHFKNMDTAFKRPHSMHFHGVHYGFESDGSFIPGFSSRGGAVEPGHIFTYRLEARPDSVGVWPYHDHSPSMHESIMGGLYGALSIKAPGQQSADREFVVFFGSQLGFMTINGRAFIGNTPGFHARVGELIQWDVLTLGDEFHTFHIHGHRWRSPDGTFIDTRTLGPAESFSVRIVEDVPGIWLYHCHVETHMMNGMIGLYHVRR
jgi:FtsP/CotA-like multicopper oxidase with cupredoxin domain